MGLKEVLSSLGDCVGRNRLNLTIVFAIVIAVFVVVEKGVFPQLLPSVNIIKLGILAFLLFSIYIIFSQKELGRERLYLITGLIVIVLLTLPFCVFNISDVVSEEAVSREITSMAIDYCAILASAISVIFVAITLVLQREQLHKSLVMEAQTIDNAVLKVINEFLSTDMLAVRNSASDLRDKLRNNRKSTVASLRFAFERQIRDDYYYNKDWQKFKDGEMYKHYAAFTRLMRFFDMVSLYKLSDTTAKSVHFYYVWWRSFMVEVKDIFVDVWDKVPENQRYLSFMPNWVYTIERLDKQLEDHGLKLK